VTKKSGLKSQKEVNRIIRDMNKRVAAHIRRLGKQ